MQEIFNKILLVITTYPMQSVIIAGLFSAVICGIKERSKVK